MDTDFDFKPINEGLGFHRKVKPLDIESDSDETFSFSTLGPGTLSKPKVESNSRDQSKGLLSSGAGSGSAAPTVGGKSKHNAKSVSDLIAALPPSFDILSDDSASTQAPTMASSNGSNAPTPASLRKSPLFSSPSGIATPGAPAAASFGATSTGGAADKAADGKRGFLKMPLGRNDYGMKPKTSVAASAAILAASAAAGAITGRSPSSLDENVAKTFPTVFPHLGSLAGKPASTAKAGPATSGKLAKSTSTRTSLGTSLGIDIYNERPLATHFGSAILDTLVSVGLGCVLLAVALSITNVNLLALLENTQTDRETIAALAILFVAGGLLYVLAARSFMGATLGEWSYEIRVGEEKSRTRWFYPALVMWRGVLVAATGFIVFPIISMIAGKDVLQYLTGLELVGLAGAAPAANE